MFSIGAAAAAAPAVGADAVAVDTNGIGGTAHAGGSGYIGRLKDAAAGMVAAGTLTDATDGGAYPIKANW